MSNERRAERWILAAGLSGVALLLIGLKLGGRVGLPESGRGLRVSDLGSAPELDPGGAPGPVPPTPSGRAVEARESHASPAIPGRPEPRQTLEHRSLSIRTVHAESGSPIAEAQVWVGTPPPQDPRTPGTARAGRRAPRRALEAHLRRTGRPARSDVDGLVRLTVPAGPLAVAARHGGLYGEGRLTPDADGVVSLELRRDRSLSVRAVDAGGAPVFDCPLALVARFPGDAARALCRVPLGNSAGPGGTLHVPHVQALIGDLVPVGVAVDLAGAEGAETALAPTWSGALEVRVVAPPLAELTVLVLDGQGAPRPGAVVRLCAAWNAEAESERGRPRDLVLGWADEAGRVRVAPLVAHRPYRIEVSDTGQPTDQRVLEPLWPGEQRRLEVRLASLPVVLLGRAVDALGEPLAERQLSIMSAPPRPWSVIARSDAAGLFRIELRPSFADRPLEGLSVELLGEGGQRTKVAAELETLLPRAGENQLGDLALEETPIVLAGRVLGAAPDLHDVRLQVEEWTDGGWRGLPGVEVYPLGARAFELRGRLEPRPHRLVVEAPHCLPVEPVEFRLGERELALELQPGGSLSAAVDARAAIAAELVPEGAAAAEPVRGRRAGRRSRDGRLRFNWTGLPTGSYTLRLFEVGESAPRHELFGIQVEAGREATDARLERIELSG